MAKTLVLGLLASVLAVAIMLLASAFGVGNSSAVLAVGGGLTLGLIRDRSPLARYGGFFVGMVLGIFALLAALGGWIGFVLAMVVITVISALTGGRLPLWSMILGGGTFAAMYLPTFEESAWYIETQYPSAFFLALAASSGAFIVAVLVEVLLGRELELENQLPNDSADSSEEPAAAVGSAQ